MLVLGVDPGLAKMGVAVVNVEGRKVDPIALHCIVTEKSERKLHRHASDDLVVRAGRVYVALSGILFENRVQVVCAESISYPRSSVAAMMMGISWGVLVALCERHGLPLVHASPQEIKKAVTGSKTATKDEMISAVVRLNPVTKWPLGPKGGEELKEHAADAVGAVVAQLDSPLLKGRNAG